MKRHHTIRNSKLPALDKNRITFSSGGKDYVLEFTRASVLEMNRKGFNPEKFIENPVLLLPDMFAGAFIARHRHMKREFIDALYIRIAEKVDLIDVLSTMYAAVLEGIATEFEKSVGDIQWKHK